jgi:putative oxidoreductase
MAREESSMSSSDLTARLAALEPYVRSILRIMAGFLFLQFGTAKLFAWPGAMLPDGGTFPLLTKIGIAGFLEAFGGGLMLVGLFTRPVAFVLSGEMAFAYFLEHAPKGFWTAFNGGTEAVLFCFVWLYFVVAGPGPWSVDGMLRRR